jgi:hypothetical protein
MEENKSELIMKKGNILDLLNLKDKYNKDFSNIKQSKLYKKLILEKILDNIKNIQLVLLSQKSLNKAGNKFSYKTLITLLKDLKVELNSTFKGKKQKGTKIKYRPQKLCDHSLIKHITGIYDKNIIINPKLISELSDLKLLNFKLENHIEFIDTKIKILSNNKLNEKNPYIFSYPLLNGKNENIEPYNALHENLLNIRERFKSVVKKKNFQNNVINQLNTAVNILKEEHKLENKKYKNEYIITSQIINEESKDYPTKTSSFANDNYCDKEKINSNKIENDILYKGKLIYI